MGKGEKEARNPRDSPLPGWESQLSLSPPHCPLLLSLFLMKEETIASPTEAIFTSQMSSKDWQGWGKIKSDGGKNSSHQRTAPGPAGLPLGGSSTSVTVSAGGRNSRLSEAMPP